MTDDQKLERVLALIRKLQALADRGVGGEQVNAAQRLKELCEKYNIDLSDDIEKPYKREYDVMIKHQPLFWAIYFHVVPCSGSASYWRSNGSRRRFKVEATTEQHAEITYLFDLYAADFDKQLRNFVRAYIAKQEIEPTYAEGYVPKRSSKPLTEDDYYAAMLMAGISKKTVRRAIEA